jgi:transcriptional regulator with XRE-family HTH domain
MKTNAEKLNLLKEFLRRRQVEITTRRGHMVNEAEIARDMGVSSAALNNWFIGNRLPMGENIHILADYFGPEIYDILEERPPIPNDPIIKAIVRAWPKLSEQARKEIEQIIKK